MGAVCVAQGDKTTTLINKDLRVLRVHEQSKIKMLVLGPGDSGKSTFVRQMKIIHNGTLENRERERGLQNLRQNIFDAFLHVTQNGGKEHIPQTGYENYHQLLDNVSNDISSSQLQEMISSIWKISDFRNFVTDTYCLTTNHNIIFLFDNADRLLSPDCLPTNIDILHSRTKTTGVLETEISLSNDIQKQFVFIDVGGQRSERRKWINCFDGVYAVIFIVALDEYNLVLSEDEKTNRLTESLELWESITKEEYFHKKKFMLFLNKYDLFKEKIKKVPLDDYVEGLLGSDGVVGKDRESAVKCVETLFRKRFGQDTVYLDVYKTCALDTENCRRVFRSISEQIGRLGLEQSGIV